MKYTILLYDVRCIQFSLLFAWCNRMLHITSFTLNSYHINSISKWLRHMYSIMAQQYQIPGLMAIIFSQFIFVLFLPTTFVLCFWYGIPTIFFLPIPYVAYVCVFIYKMLHAYLIPEIEDENFIPNRKSKDWNISQFDIGRFKKLRVLKWIYLFFFCSFFRCKKLPCWWTEL